MCHATRENGTLSSIKRIKHINVHCYFIADKVAKGELWLEHCLIQVIKADVFVKPLQRILLDKL